MSKIAVFLAEGFEEIEGLTVVDILRRAKIEATTVSITGKREVTGSHGICVMADRLFEEVSFEQYDGLVLPGGMPGADNLAEHLGLNEQLKIFVKEKKLVAAICAAPLVLGRAGVLKGRKAVCYPGYEKELIGAKVAYDGVVVDGNLITSRGMGKAIRFSLTLVEYLMDTKTADSIKESIIYED
ncbi:DJ-1/PfpI family protein [Lachnospiraceae bacterium ZAX-1]